MKFIFAPKPRTDKKTTQGSLWINCYSACKKLTAEAAQSQITNDQGSKRDRQPAGEPAGGWEDK
jgi:hypothetical protein